MGAVLTDYEARARQAVAWYWKVLDPPTSRLEGFHTLVRHVLADNGPPEARVHTHHGLELPGFFLPTRSETGLRAGPPPLVRMAGPPGGQSGPLADSGRSPHPPPVSSRAPAQLPCRAVRVASAEARTRQALRHLRAPPESRAGETVRRRPRARARTRSQAIPRASGQPCRRVRGVSPGAETGSGAARW